METFVYVFLDHDFIPAGRLRVEDLGSKNYRSTFAYGHEYLKRENALAIDPLHLPLTKQQFETSSDFSIFNSIRDAGPDRWGHYLLDKYFGRSLTELEFILAGGIDRVGGLAFGPDLTGPKILGPNGYGPHSSKPIDLADALQASEDAVVGEDTERLTRLLRYGPSLGGARPKVNVQWNGVPYIAKFSVSLDTRNEPLIEYATMKLAALAGLDVPRIDKTKVLNRDVYLIERFDRGANEIGEVRRLFLSGLTVANLHERDSSQWNYGHLCEAITKLCNQPAADKLELYRRVIFNILVNNDDDHPRNHGFIHQGGHNWRLSKLYDVVPRDQATNTFRLAMNIGEKGKEASKSNALSASKYFGLSIGEGKGIWEQIEAVVVGRWREVFLNAGLTHQEISRFEHSIGPK